MATIPSFGSDFVSTSCVGETQNFDAIAITGGCSTSNGVALQTNSIFGDNGWSCTWNNPKENPLSANMTVHIVCLLPEGATTPDAGP